MELLRKEIEVNHREQEVIRSRMATISNYLQTLPKNDPQYGLIQSQIGMDQVELDELKNQEEKLQEQIEKDGQSRKQL